MGGARGTLGKKRFCWGNCKVREQLEDIVVDGSVLIRHYEDVGQTNHVSVCVCVCARARSVSVRISIGGM